VSIVVVTYDSELWIERCLSSALRQTYRPIELVIIDNASSDSTLARVEAIAPEARLVRNQTNTGFAGGHNQGIRMTRGEFYLALNPDVEMEPEFLAELVRAARSDLRVGSVSGKLLRPPEADGHRRVDSTGIYMTPGLRHLDRGSGEIDRGQYERPQRVFGASGAAALYRRAMLVDVALDGEFFDEDFFAYREDADLAWRAQLRGWSAVYAPTALATHVRRVLPERRHELPPAINMHSVKNRYLLRVKNQAWLEFLALSVPSLARDMAVIAYVLVFERSSLPGLRFVAANFRRIWAKRRRIQRGRRVPAGAILRWFRRYPVAFDL
jgi:GT2 family glycosyltransferase